MFSGKHNQTHHVCIIQHKLSNRPQANKADKFRAKQYFCYEVKLVTLKLGLGEEAQEGLLPPEPAEPAVSFPGVDLQPVMTDGEAVVSFLAAS